VPKTPGLLGYQAEVEVAESRMGFQLQEHCEKKNNSVSTFGWGSGTSSGASGYPNCAEQRRRSRTGIQMFIDRKAPNRLT
jgi:hypothetical protein